MRPGRFSIKKEIKEMEIEKKMSSNSNGKVKEEGHLSGAYIRSLVKQLTSSKPKDSNDTNPKDQTAENSLETKVGQGWSETPTKSQQQQQHHHKKQVRRRLHTSRPYQERLLNMAEARREIVTALKFHRAAMKQANNDNIINNEQNQPSQQPTLEFESANAMMIKPCRSRIISNQQPQEDPSIIIWPHNYNSTTIIPTLPFDPHNLPPLPNQALGLNLNFHDLANNIELATPLFQTPTASTTYSSSSAASASSPSSVAEATAASGGGGGMHAAMDEEEIAEIRSIGEQHQMEWSDTMSMVTSAYWLKFLKPSDQEDHDHDQDHHHHHLYPFHDQYHHQLMEFPPWLGTNDNHHFDDHYSSDDYFHSPSLSCMEIGEIEGMDGDDWLA